MTERTTELKTGPSDALSDLTVTDSVHIDLEETQEMLPRDPEPPVNDPGKFSRIEFSPEERKKMRQVKLQRLAPEFFQDTQPPNKGLQAPTAPPLEAEPVLVIPTRRLPVGVVLLCVLGAVFILGLVLFRSFLSGPASTRTPTPTTGMAEMPVVPGRLQPSATEEHVAPSPPAIAATAAERAPSKGEVEQPTRAAAAVRAKTPLISKTGHAAPPVPSAPPPQVDSAPLPTKPSVAPSSTPAPASTTPWFDYKP